MIDTWKHVWTNESSMEYSLYLVRMNWKDCSITSFMKDVPCFSKISNKINLLDEGVLSSFSKTLDRKMANKNLIPRNHKRIYQNNWRAFKLKQYSYLSQWLVFILFYFLPSFNDCFTKLLCLLLIRALFSTLFSCKVSSIFSDVSSIKVLRLAVERVWIR